MIKKYINQSSFGHFGAKTAWLEKGCGRLSHNSRHPSIHSSIFHYLSGSVLKDFKRNILVSQTFCPRDSSKLKNAQNTAEFPVSFNNYLN